jgi:hypothetical protein
MLDIDIKMQKSRGNLKRLQNDLKQRLASKMVKVGFPSGAKQADGAISVAQKAIYNEYGSNNGRIPPRPFMRQSVQLNAETIKHLKVGLLRRIYNGSMTPEQALAILGQNHADKIKRVITSEGTFLPNAPYTVKKKGDDKPLIETSQMVNSVTFKVV